VVISALSGACPQQPYLDLFLDGEAPAWCSPPLLARVRSRLSSAADAAGIASGNSDLDQRDTPAPAGRLILAYGESDLAVLS